MRLSLPFGQLATVVINSFIYILEYKTNNNLMNKISIIFLFIAVISTFSLTQQKQRKTLQTYDYDYFFNEGSELTIIILSCSTQLQLSISVKSILLFNTMKIRKIWIGTCQQMEGDLSSYMPKGYETHLSQNHIQFIKATSETSSMTQVLQEIYKKVSTKYIFQVDERWEMVRGYGFIQSAIQIIKYARENDIKISQIVANFPYWRQSSRLQQMQWTQNNVAYHIIKPFNQQNYHHFTLSPSVFELQNIYHNLLDKDIRKIGEQAKCPEQKYEWDKCNIWAIGQQIYQKGYRQAFYNDGSGTVDFVYIE